MTGKFEAHITFDVKYAEVVKRMGQFHWKYSAFDADPVMGAKPYCYLTAYSTDDAALLKDMRETVQLFEQAGVSALRQKIERIIYDTKTNVDEIETIEVCLGCGKPTEHRDCGCPCGTGLVRKKSN